MANPRECVFLRRSNSCEHPVLPPIRPSSQRPTATRHVTLSLARSPESCTTSPNAEPLSQQTTDDGQLPCQTLPPGQPRQLTKALSIARVAAPLAIEFQRTRVLILRTATARASIGKDGDCCQLRRLCRATGSRTGHGWPAAPHRTRLATLPKTSIGRIQVRLAPFKEEGDADEDSSDVDSCYSDGRGRGHRRRRSRAPAHNNTPPMAQRSSTAPHRSHIAAPQPYAAPQQYAAPGLRCRNSGARPRSIRKPRPTAHPATAPRPSSRRVTPLRSRLLPRPTPRSPRGRPPTHRQPNNLPTWSVRNNSSQQPQQQPPAYPQTAMRPTYPSLAQNGTDPTPHRRPRIAPHARPNTAAT